jgi:hypothetical protein
MEGQFQKGPWNKKSNRSRDGYLTKKSIFLEHKMTEEKKIIIDDDYRKMLENCAFQSANYYDTALMSLSGGALGVSFAFIKEIVPSPASDTITWLWFAWLSLGGSLSAIILSMLFSQQSIRTAINQIDDGTIYKKKPGGIFSFLTIILTWLSGIMFVLGVLLLSYFAKINLIIG